MSSGARSKNLEVTHVKALMRRFSALGTTSPNPSGSRGNSAARKARVTVAEDT